MRSALLLVVLLVACTPARKPHCVGVDITRINGFTGDTIEVIQGCLLLGDYIEGFPYTKDQLIDCNTCEVCRAVRDS